MRIGKQDDPHQSISTSDAHSITVRGLDLCDEVIGHLDFTSYFWLLVTGYRPSDPQRVMTNAVLAAIAEHGVVPSVAAARMTLAAAPEAFQGAVAAGLLGCGSVVLGSAEAAGRFLTLCATGEAPATALIDELERLRAARRPVPGLGHPQHSGGDPRADRLMALARETGVAGIHVGLMEQAARAVPAIFRRDLPINVNGAIAAVMLDASFPLGALKGLALLARTAGLIAHLAEEQSRPIGFILSGAAANGVQYQPPKPDPFGA